jgi:hypothetical protein
MVTDSDKKSLIYECKLCNIITSNKKDYKKHILTAKHLNKQSGDIGDKESHILRCKICNKQYKSRNGIWKHSKVCKIGENENITISISENNTSLNPIIHENDDFKKIILEVVRNITELQKQNNELQKQVLDACKTNTTTINSHNNNKTFNLQFFLNEQCKDAMNISDFANSFDLQLSDLESVGELGYVEGIAKIFVDKLNSMDIYKRPIHCSDAKREILYVKDDNKWEKEERSNPKIRYAIKTISFRNMKLANLWSDTHPESKDGDSHMNDIYMKLIKESTGGNGETSVNEDKIIRRIVKNILIDKK